MGDEPIGQEAEPIAADVEAFEVQNFENFGDTAFNTARSRVLSEN